MRTRFVVVALVFAVGAVNAAQQPVTPPNQVGPAVFTFSEL